ncbi:hypothetical protein GOP47_0018801 [Adiantum capillus-veneris]|uniref:Uncharacterized protein n=1 Tax=Adiantum capillus-veneris TaxID=13818 RepID=A0A9D4UEH4_ADICA|nr:hypothetical protein GOP47_0018801 [Adiantum capillus-veneris]
MACFLLLTLLLLSSWVVCQAGKEESGIVAGELPEQLRNAVHKASPDEDFHNLMANETDWEMFPHSDLGIWKDGDLFIALVTWKLLQETYEYFLENDRVLHAEDDEEVVNVIYAKLGISNSMYLALPMDEIGDLQGLKVHEDLHVLDVAKHISDEVEDLHGLVVREYMSDEPPQRDEYTTKEQKERSLALLLDK